MGYKITVGDVTREYPEGTKIIELAKEFQPENEYPYILCEHNCLLRIRTAGRLIEEVWYCCFRRHCSI